MENINPEGDPGRMFNRCSSLSSLDESSQVAARHTAAPPVDPNTVHAQQLLAELAVLRQDASLCDVVLIAGGDEGSPPVPHEVLMDMETLELKEEVQPGTSTVPEVPQSDVPPSRPAGVSAHRAVLAAGSPYFRAMFTQFDERSMHTITIKNVEAEALEAIVEYIYNPDSLSIHENNVQALMSAASLLGVSGVRALCAVFLSRALCADNVLGVRAFADLLAAPELLATADHYLDLHVEQVFSCEEWVSCSVETVCAVLSRDTLRLGAGGERAALDAATAWVQHDANRAPLLGRVLSHVRLPLLPREELARRAFLPPLDTPDIQVKDLIIEALSCGLAGGASAAAAARRRPRARPRARQMLLVVGGQAPKAISEVEALELCEEVTCREWAGRAPLPSRRCRAGVALHQGQVWAVGGFNGTLRVRTVDVYDVARDAWAPGPNMRARRSTLGVCSVNGDLYAIGGFDGAVGLHTGEVLRSGASEWEALPCMVSRRSSVAVAYLDGHIYAVGGYDGASRQCLSSVEAYSVAAGLWQAAPNMLERRSGAAVAALNKRLYAVGGHDGPAVRRSAEYLEPGAVREGAVRWTAAPGMRRARRNAAAACHAGRLYVLGGDDAHTSLDTVEVFDEAVGAWTELSCRMHIGRSYGGACVVPRDHEPHQPP